LGGRQTDTARIELQRCGRRRASQMGRPASLMRYWARGETLELRCCDGAGICEPGGAAAAWASVHAARTDNKSSDRLELQARLRKSTLATAGGLPLASSLQAAHPGGKRARCRANLARNTPLQLPANKTQAPTQALAPSSFLPSPSALRFFSHSNPPVLASYQTVCTTLLISPLVNTITVSMSEAPKTVEEPVVAPAGTEAPATTEPAAEVKPAESEAVEPAAEASAAAEEAVKEEEAAPKEEVKPIEEGVLGYKGPGLLK
jgi:hypothetical protein